ncbi:MAG: peptidoglycan DD-metalloendopeptidase family protein [Acidobacteria bacterium]|nr:peptidoglycan DD-metalloendopeptidase family protein [Acidobacteriota bacterium]MBI3490066.1 peptidoglycan DD-metalloendopeptidase family protein [Acidobacteriota bacterium]
MNRIGSKLGALTLAVAGSAWVWAGKPSLPFKPSPVPGGVAVVAVGGKDSAPKVTYHGEPVLTRRSGGGWVAMVGIPLSANPGQDAVEVDGRPVSFAVKPKRYPEQRVQLKNQRLVTPNEEDEARIAKEQLLMGPAWKAWPEGLAASLNLRQPTPGSLTASFGMRRIFNGVPRSPHSGLDIRAPQGQAVRAPAAGVVVLTGDFFYSGNAVFLAHGEGVVSLLCHLSKITVKEGQKVQAGDLLGEVGMTGRATGPHLHWSLSLNNARVDPRLFL